MIQVSSQSNRVDRNVYNIPEGGGDLASWALLLQIERYDILEAQVRDEFDDMQRRNDWLKTANLALAALRANRPNSDKDPERWYGRFDDPHGKDVHVHKWMLDNGIDIEQEGGDAHGTQADFDAAISNLKARIDNVNSESGMAVIRLQSLMDKAQQCLELTTNLLAKASKAKENILSNIR
ncbi:hypothetical protein [Rhizobium gallicum]|uniref:hypothetical protein n=1 Tax=Rhizobium gallicum TaxID=56730 RepID=UPI001EF7E310|nr:hypothetical protein [Rhizobium gallicum]ULJ74435.1 hypothetical protein L2W42_21455 [Rhizobium gallicum]